MKLRWMAQFLPTIPTKVKVKKKQISITTLEKQSIYKAKLSL
jgi:hypothetical protein